MVEAMGIEPMSEKKLINSSTYIVNFWLHIGIGKTDKTSQYGLKENKIKTPLSKDFKIPH